MARRRAGRTVEKSALLRSRVNSSADPEWGIERAWVRQSAENTQGPLSTSELARFQVLCALGNGGLGKTWEISKLAQLERDGGRLVAEIPLARYNSVDALRGVLRSALADVGSKGAIYLDGLDEVMVPVRSAANVISEWIANELSDRRKVSLRLSCRSSVWPNDLLQTIHRAYRDESVGICELQPLDELQIAAVAACHKLDAAAFVLAVRRVGCLVLAQQPLTLGLLLRIFADRADLPASRRELLDEAVTHSMIDSAERRDRGTNITMPLNELQDVAERLAIITTLSGRDVVDMNDQPASNNALGHIELAQLPRGNGPSLDSNTLWTLANTRMMSGRGIPRQYGFLHRQFAEHLAGRRLAKLPLYQTIGFLASDAGSERGVAGPLREVAAVAATYNNDIAAWIARTDPEIIGISDVADDKVRKLALAGLFDKFRRNELTDSQIAADKISFHGLRYATVADDVAAVLEERTPQPEDVHAFAIELCEAWQLGAVVPELVGCALDKSLPLHTRSGAAYAVQKIGTDDQRQLLKPLISGGDDDEYDELKGIALMANWPQRISASELFAVLTAPKRESHIGSYRLFLHDLDETGFDGSADLIAALTWAREFVEHSGVHDAGRALMRRIIMAAIKNPSDHATLVALAAFVSHASRINATSLFGDPQDSSALADLLHTPVRREVLLCLMAQGEDPKRRWGLDEQLPGILNLDDFPWLLARACNPKLPNEDRQWAASLAGSFDWQRRSEFVDLWLAAYQNGTLPDSLQLPLVSDLSSDEVIAQRASFQKTKRGRLKRRPVLPAVPAVSIETMLDRCEQVDPGWFGPLSRELARRPEPHQFELQRFLTDTPGWAAADELTRHRVVNAAEVYLNDPAQFMQHLWKAKGNEILNDGGMAALFLLQVQRPKWLEGRTAEWWTNWAPFIVRELHSDLSGEPQQSKQELIALLHHHAADSVRANLLAIAQDPEQSGRLPGLCRLLAAIEDQALDELLIDAVVDGVLGPDALTTVSDFVLRRNPRSAACLVDSVLQNSSDSEQMDDARVRVSVAALSIEPARFHQPIFDFMRRQTDLAKQILEMFAYRDLTNARDLRALGPSVSGELLEMLFETFPPDSDPDRTGAYWVTARDAAISLRGHLITQLVQHADARAASQVFKKLEVRFGDRYPWLRRPRSELERRVLLASWAPLPPRAIADTLARGEARLLRSPADVLEMIRFAVREYERTLQRKVPADIHDLWNTPRNHPASPKDEEVVSDKLLGAIERAFKGIAVVASREVQLFRRVRSGAKERAGARADLILTLPAVGIPADEKITVPIEVKRSCSAEAKTGLRQQLVKSYLLPHGYTHGAFVVAYLNAHGIAASHKPVWKTIEDAQSDIKRQADDVGREFANGIVVAGIVFDARLPGAIRVDTPLRASRRRAPRITANRVRRQRR